jgi:2-deoxy-scyllo-inosamine dehydrogenase (SAM-dependent)
MSPALFRKIIDELADMGFDGCINPQRYGEPLTDSRLIQFMQYAHARLPRATLKLYTNGDFLTPALLDQLYDAGVRDYFITVHSADEPSFTDSINRISQLKKHMKNKRRNIKLEYQTCYDMALCNRGGLVAVDERRQPTWSCTDEAIAISYRGDVLLCCNDYLGVAAFGNLQHESLIDIWSKPEFVKIRRELRRNVYTLDICKKCTHSRASQ